MTGVMLPLIVFAVGARLIVAPSTRTLVTGIPDDDSGVASSLCNTTERPSGAAGWPLSGRLPGASSTVTEELTRTPAAPGTHVARDGVASVSPAQPDRRPRHLKPRVAEPTLGVAGAAVPGWRHVTIMVRCEDRPDGMLGSDLHWSEESVPNRYRTVSAGRSPRRSYSRCASGHRPATPTANQDMGSGGLGTFDAAWERRGMRRWIA